MAKNYHKIVISFYRNIWCQNCYFDRPLGPRLITCLAREMLIRIEHIFSFQIFQWFLTFVYRKFFSGVSTNNFKIQIKDFDTCILTFV